MRDLDENDPLATGQVTVVGTRLAKQVTPEQVLTTYVDRPHLWILEAPRHVWRALVVLGLGCVWYKTVRTEIWGS